MVRSNVGESGVDSRIAGPARTTLSVRVPLTSLEVMKAYAWPCVAAGIVADTDPPLTVAGTLIVSSPLTKVMKNDEGMLAVVVKEIVTLGATGFAVVRVRVGNALNGNGGFSGGHETMKAEARVKMALGPTGVPTMFADATSLRESRWMDWWRPSATRIAPAAVRMSFEEITGAPPR